MKFALSQDGGCVPALSLKIKSSAYTLIWTIQKFLYYYLSRTTLNYKDDRYVPDVSLKINSSIYTLT